MMTMKKEYELYKLKYKEAAKVLLDSDLDDSSKMVAAESALVYTMHKITDGDFKAMERMFENVLVPNVRKLLNEMRIETSNDPVN